MSNNGRRGKGGWGWWGWLGLLVGVWVLAACGAGDTKQPMAIMLTTLDDQQVAVTDYRGQVVLVNFWATWCGPCREEMPALETYYQAHQRDGFVLLAVNAGEKPEKVRAYIAQGGYTFPVLLDRDGAAADALGGVRGMPTSFILDGAGVIVYEHVGALTSEVLTARVTALLGKE